MTEGEVQLVSDGDGLAVIGEATAVERFLRAEGLPSTDLTPRLRSVLSAGSAVTRGASEVADHSGRWVKLTKESAHAVEKHGLRESAVSGLQTGVVKGPSGQIKGFVEFAKTPGSLLSNPALLAGAAGVMAQVAMQQTMDEITDYLETIDRKVDDVLRAQRDAVVADMIGIELVIDEAMAVRDRVGRVSEVTWSKVQGSTMTIARTQAYALRQLDALAEKIERETKVRELADVARDAESQVQEWLAVLARCFQLQDAVAILELDRVLDSSPDELDHHRIALQTARQKRRELIAGCTDRLIERMELAAARANEKVLVHPVKSPALVRSSELVNGTVVDLQDRLGIERERSTLDARRWGDAADEVKEKALAKGADGIDSAKSFSTETFERAKSTAGTISTRATDRARRWRSDNEDADEDG